MIPSLDNSSPHKYGFSSVINVKGVNGNKQTPGISSPECVPEIALVKTYDRFHQHSILLCLLIFIA